MGVLQENQLSLGLGTGVYKMRPRHLILSKSKKACQKDQLEGASIETNANIKKTDNYNGQKALNKQASMNLL